MFFFFFFACDLIRQPEVFSVNSYKAAQNLLLMVISAYGFYRPHMFFGIIYILLECSLTIKHLCLASLPQVSLIIINTWNTWLFTAEYVVV